MCILILSSLAFVTATLYLLVQPRPKIVNPVSWASKRSIGHISYFGKILTLFLPQVAQVSSKKGNKKVSTNKCLKNIWENENNNKVNTITTFRTSKVVVLNDCYLRIKDDWSIHFMTYNDPMIDPIQCKFIFESCAFSNKCGPSTRIMQTVFCSTLAAGRSTHHCQGIFIIITILIMTTTTVLLTFSNLQNICSATRTSSTTALEARWAHKHGWWCFIFEGLFI